MARDYKGAANTTKNSKNTQPGWLLFVAGLAIGLFCALLVYLQMQSLNPSQKKTTKLKMPAPTIEIASEAHVNGNKNTLVDEVTNMGAKKSTSTKNEETTVSSLHFDFYTILPELEVLIPDEEIKKKRVKVDVPADKNNAVTKKSIIADDDAYMLQAGSFKQFEQADRRKAKLALLGTNANIQRVTINDNEVWHRVRIGPFNDLKKLNDIRILLYKNKINAIRLKVKSEKK